MSSTITTRGPWHRLPADIQLLVLEALLQGGCSLAAFATVSRVWQTVIERHNFARIKLTPSRVAEFDSITYRNRAFVRYIWLCLELEEYDCKECDAKNFQGLSIADNTLIVTTFQDLFSALSRWEPEYSLLLDISVHSPSESEHWFKYLTFKPDLPSDECDQERWAEVEKSVLAKLDDHQHGWSAGSRIFTPPWDAVFKNFYEIMDTGPFDSVEEEYQWWNQLPLVPAITGVLLRQQTRLRWKPSSLARLFSRLPRLQEIHYEPWRELEPLWEKATDKYSELLFKSLASSQLQKLILFENHNPQYQRLNPYEHVDLIRMPSSCVSQAIAKTSLKLEYLSASFMVDASRFFLTRKSSWEWPRLTSLALTSQLLAPDTSPDRQHARSGGGSSF